MACQSCPDSNNALPQQTCPHSSSAPRSTNVAHWLPSHWTGHSSDEIAVELHRISTSLLRQPTYLPLRSCLFEEFYTWHSDLEEDLLEFLRGRDNQAEKYLHIEEKLRWLNPFVYATVARALDRLCFGIPQTQWPSLESVVDLSENFHQSEGSSKNFNVLQDNIENIDKITTLADWIQFFKDQNNNTEDNFTYVGSDSLFSHEGEQDNWTIAEDEGGYTGINHSTITVDSESNTSLFRSRCSEANEILQQCFLEDIYLFCRFASYIDPELLSQLMRENVRVLDMIVDESSQGPPEEKTKALILDLRGPPASLAMPTFSPRLTGDQSEIVSSIDRASRHLHQAISFKDALAYLNDPEDIGNSACQFIFWHEKLHIQLRNYLRCYPSKIREYARVEEELRDRNPFAHWAVAGCRQAVPTRSCPIPRFLASLGQFFEQYQGSLLEFVKQLRILEDRFDRTRENIDLLNALDPFNTDMGLYNLCTNNLPCDVALALTSTDTDFMARLDLSSSDDRRTAGIIFDIRCREIEECAIPEIGLQDFLYKLIVHLYEHRNFFSLIPSLQAMRNAQFDEEGYIGLFVLLDHSDNYRTYREECARGSGVCFPFPHGREVVQREKLKMATEKRSKHRSCSDQILESLGSLVHRLFTYKERIG